MTNEQVANISKMYLNGMTVTEIAYKENLSDETVRRVLKNLGVFRKQIIKIGDSPEEIQQCLSCEKPKCINCLAYKKG